jgi:hypothetical protein
MRSKGARVFPYEGQASSRAHVKEDDAGKQLFHLVGGGEEHRASCKVSDYRHCLPLHIKLPPEPDSMSSFRRARYPLFSMSKFKSARIHVYHRIGPLRRHLGKERGLPCDGSAI